MLKFSQLRRREGPGANKGDQPAGRVERLKKRQTDSARARDGHERLDGLAEEATARGMEAPMKI